MLTRSDRFDREIRFSHSMVARVELWVDGNYETDLIIDNGNVRQRDNEIRRRCDMIAMDPTFTLTPTSLLDDLAPAGNELKVYRGIRLTTGVEEYLPQGVFTIDDVRVDSSGDGHKLRVEGFDRARRVERGRLTEPVVIANGTDLGEALQTLVLAGWDQAEFLFPETTETTNSIYLGEGKDPWKRARSLAESFGYELFFDEYGRCTLREVTTNIEEADWEYDAEQDDSLLLYLNRRLNNNDAYNHVIVTGENSDNDEPVRGEAYDNNPASPTYIYGKFGDIPIFVKSGDVQTDAQATVMAAALLEKGLGVTESVNITSVVHPAHEIGDVIRLNLPEANTDSLYVVDSVTLPLVATRALNIGCRERIINA